MRETRENVTCEGVLFTPPRRLQQIAFSCTRSDYNKSKKSCQSVTLSSLLRKRLQQVALFFDAAHFTSSEGIDFDEFMSHSTATKMCWMMKTTDAISDTRRGESVQVALLQTHGEDGAFLPDVFREIDQVFFFLSNSSSDGR